MIDLMYIKRSFHPAHHLAEDAVETRLHRLKNNHDFLLQLVLETGILYVRADGSFELVFENS
jgi:hypothetical protein